MRATSWKKHRAGERRSRQAERRATAVQAERHAREKAEQARVGGRWYQRPGHPWGRKPVAMREAAWRQAAGKGWEVCVGYTWAPVLTQLLPAEHQKLRYGRRFYRSPVPGVSVALLILAAEFLYGNHIPTSRRYRECLARVLSAPAAEVEGWAALRLLSRDEDGR